MKFIAKFILMLVYINILTSQVIEEHTLFDENGNELDVFAYQIPENYNSNNSHPLLVAFHQWGGNQTSPFSTQFDDEANARNWIFMSPFGGSSNNYNHQDAQEWVKLGIQWLEENYNIDSGRIYMVGGSMGGASGAIYANNHLNPTEPMVAATASASGILDCERRAIEMDGNNSMIEWFGGSYDEVPFEYHRNSAVYFADSTQSMHYNLQYTPLYLDFGQTETHRTHAEDLYNLLQGYNHNMWIDTIPIGSHGYSVIDEVHTCDWFNQFELEDSPDTINVNLDEPSRAYWIEAYNQFSDNDFIRINARIFYGDIWYSPIPWEGYGFFMNEYSNSDSLVLHVLDEEYSTDNNITFYIDGELNNIGFTGPISNGSNIENIHAFIINDDPICTSFNFNMDEDNIIWVERYDLYDGICQSYTPYKVSFDFSLPEENDDINQDGIWDILDIVLTVNFIMGNIDPTNVQFNSADLNNDNILDVLDIVTMVNMIMDR